MSERTGSTLTSALVAIGDEVLSGCRGRRSRACCVNSVLDLSSTVGEEGEDERTNWSPGADSGAAISVTAGDSCVQVSVLFFCPDTTGHWTPEWQFDHLPSTCTSIHSTVQHLRDRIAGKAEKCFQVEMSDSPQRAANNQSRKITFGKFWLVFSREKNFALHTLHRTLCCAAFRVSFT